MFTCAKCSAHGCYNSDLSKTLPECPSKEAELQEKVKALYQEEENHKIAYNAAITEAEGYCSLTRIMEIILFMKKCGYKRIGMAFCIGLKKEAAEVNKILEHHGFEVISVICKNGNVPKSDMGITDDKTVRGCAKEVMCNPIGQALLLNQEKTEFNILLGLCVGHDTLVIKYLEAPITVLAVKDRVTGHNPLAAIYNAQGYYKNKLYI